MINRRNPAVARVWIWLATLALLGACAQPPAVPPTPTVVPTAAVTPTLTPVPTLTDTPAPTPLPGTQVCPLSSLAHTVPWLPQDKSRNPLSAYYGFNFNKPPFNNLLVRQAFAAAVDKEQIAEQALHFKFRDAVPATTLTPATVLGRDLNGEIGIRFDPALAETLLQQAGYATADSFPRVKLLVYMRSSAAPGAHFRIAETVVDMWKTNLGITVDLEAVESPAALRSRMQNDPPEMYLLGWGADYVDPDDFLRVLFRSDSEWNYGHFKSTEFDNLVDRAASGGDPGSRQILYIQAEQVLTEKLTAIIPLWHSLGYLPP